MSVTNITSQVEQALHLCELIKLRAEADAAVKAANQAVNDARARLDEAMELRGKAWDLVSDAMQAIGTTS